MGDAMKHDSELHEGITYSYDGEIPTENRRRSLDGAYYPFCIHTITVESGMSKKTFSHRHKMIEMLYFISGGGSATVGKQTFDFSAGDLIIANSYETHSLDIKNDSTVYYVVQLEAELLKSAYNYTLEMKYVLPFIMNSSEHRRLIPKKDIEGSRIKEYIEDAVKEYDEKNYGFEFAIRADLLRVFLCILRKWHDKNARLYSSADKNLVRIQKLLDYIDENFSANISVKDASNICHMSEGYFSRFFKSLTGMNFVKYLLRVRLSKADELLAKTNMGITEIALETGFSTASYFISKFREERGISPLKFRHEAENRDV